MSCARVAIVARPAGLPVLDDVPIDAAYLTWVFERPVVTGDRVVNRITVDPETSGCAKVAL